MSYIFLEREWSDDFRRHAVNSRAQGWESSGRSWEPPENCAEDERWTGESQTHTEAEAPLLDRRVSKKTAATIIIAVVLVGLIAAYQLGALHTLGYQRVTTKGGSTNRSGWKLGGGLRTFYLSEGTVVFVDYDTQVKTGALHLSLVQPYAAADQKNLDWRTIRQSGRGRAEFRIAKSGWYTLVIGGTPAGKTQPGALYDLRYTVRWGIQ